MADTYKISDYTLLLTVYGSKVNINAMCKQISLNSSTLFMTPAVANIEWSKVPKYATPFFGGASKLSFLTQVKLNSLHKTISDLW